MRWFTSDTHFGHANILRFEPSRPWTDLNRMNIDLVARLAAPLHAEDEVWHLGDVALGHLDSNLPFLAMLGVPVTLVAGNHDRVHPYYGQRAEQFTGVYRDRCRLAGLVLTNTRLTLADGTSVQVSHFPYGDPSVPGVEERHGHQGADKFARWRPVDDGGWLLCGHVHSDWRQHGRQINVGVDAWGGQPVPEETLVELIGLGPADRGPLPWV
ncbi:MAG: metallophosphoesterase family protein [Propionicimonas sp.]|uniref:metallophosphoesterase family protein n=1 Tax=Propionicimonas sp. TaxID=1955623 RepID=UPI003D0D44FD